MANFSFTNNTAIYTESDGVITVTLNLEGTADGYGAVLGTLTAEPAGASSGTYQFVGVSYPETGPSATAIGTGTWSQIDNDTWSTSGTTDISDVDATVKAEGELRLSTRSWSGTFG